MVSTKKTKMQYLIQNQDIQNLLLLILNELEEEIQQINSTHIYTSCLEEFNKEELLNNIEGII